MGMVFTVAGEMKVVSPAGSLSIAVSQNGIVMVTGSEPRSNVAWYLDLLKAIKERIKRGKTPGSLPLRLKSTEPLFNQAWHLKMVEVAEGVVRQAKSDASKAVPTGGNVIPYRLIQGKR